MPLPGVPSQEYGLESTTAKPRLQGTRAKDVKCEIHPGHMVLTVNKAGVVAEGEFEGKVLLDGCYWLISDLSLDAPTQYNQGSGKAVVRRGPVNKGETCVQVFLEKRKPFNTLWKDVFKSTTSQEREEQR